MMEKNEIANAEGAPQRESLALGMIVVFGTILLGFGITIVLVVTGIGAVAPASATQIPSALRWSPANLELSAPLHDDVFGVDVNEVRKIEDEHLQTYGWVDPKLKIVRIPIDKAMEIQLKQDQPEPPPKAAQPKDERKP